MADGGDCESFDETLDIVASWLLPAYGLAGVPFSSTAATGRCMVLMRIEAMNRRQVDHHTEAAVRRFLTLIASPFDVAGAIVYGSRARGTHRPDSDAEVAVILKGKHQRVLRTALAMADLAYDVLLETGINISALPVRLDEWERPEIYANPELLRSIAREGVRL